MSKQNKSRREFLKLLGAGVAALAVAPLIANSANPALAVTLSDLELCESFASLTKRFDARSLAGKEKFIKGFDYILITAKTPQGEELTELCRQIVIEMKSFYQKRLEAQLH